MGEMADMALDYVMSMEELRLDYRLGHMSQEDAYDLGIINEYGEETTGLAYSISKTCRCCGVSHLHWELHGNKWRLFDSHGLHRCTVKPLQGE